MRPEELLIATPVLLAAMIYRIVLWANKGKKGGERRKLGWLGLGIAVFYSTVAWLNVWLTNPPESDVGVPADFGDVYVILAWGWLFCAQLIVMWIVAEIGLLFDRKTVKTQHAG